jgi:hypothetical protein
MDHYHFGYITKLTKEKNTASEQGTREPFLLVEASNAVETRREPGKQ